MSSQVSSRRGARFQQPPAVSTNSKSTASQEVKLYSAHELSQMFMQFFIAQKCVTEDRVDSLIAAYNQNFSEKDKNKSFDKQTFLTKCNKLWRLFGFQVKRIFDPTSKTFYYVLANEMEDSLNKLNHWPQKESAYYFTIIDEIINAFLNNEEGELDPDNIDYRFMSIGNRDCINLARKAQISLILGEKLLTNWIKFDWFAKLAGNRITIGIRSMSTLSSYLHSKFFIYTCFTCKLACLIGVVCPKCSTCLHYHYCSEGNSRNGKTIYCPTCRPDQKMSQLKRILPPSRHDENQDTTREETDQMDSD